MDNVETQEPAPCFNNSYYAALMKPDGKVGKKEK